MTAALRGIGLHEFKGRAFVKQALASPTSANSVLSFFYGLSFDSNGSHVEPMRKGVPLDEMMKLWYEGEPEYDQLCHSFRETVRLAAKDDITCPDYLSPVDKAAAKLVLFDQLPRNIFRGSAEAFAYEENALGVCRQLMDAFLATSDEEKPLEGEIYPGYISFVVTSLSHSEEVEDHRNGNKLIEGAKKKYSHLNDTWDYQLSFLKDHTAVLDIFGRYPHRNKAKGRENTRKESEWLANVDELPVWAKSQVGAR